MRPGAAAHNPRCGPSPFDGAASPSPPRGFQRARVVIAFVMGLTFTELDEHLVVGSGPTCADDVTTLADRGVAAVVSLQTDADLGARGLIWEIFWRLWVSRGVVATRVPIVDFDKRDLLRHLDVAVDAIDLHVRQGARVYVHCTAGLNRSPSAIIAWLMLHRGMALDAATAWLMDRHEAVPFADVLKKWAKRHRLPARG